MPGNFVTIEEFTRTINSLKQMITSKSSTSDLSNVMKITQKSRTVLTLTWDATVRTLDLTSTTSTTARWALIHVAYDKTGGYAEPFYWYYYNETTNWIVQIKSDQIGTSNYDASGCCWLPLDSEQRINYKAPSGTNGREVILFGYMEPI